ncbi:MAG: aminopeptidase [Polyangiales bacterium]
MVARLALALLLVLVMGCTGVRYLAQAAHGQADIMFKARPIDEVLADPTTSKEVRDLLAEIGPIKKFGETSGLKPTPNYGKFADLGRPAVVWVVGACDPLSFTPKKWSFPIVGSVPYLGWFDKADAERHAVDLREDGYDVDVRPASAYSTLGWFNDPVLSTMLEDGPEAIGELANVVLHESMHATKYVDGQTAFDEGIASFVGHRLALGDLDSTRGPDSSAKRAYVAFEGRGEQRREQMLAGYRELAALYAAYAAGLSKTETLVRKKVILTRLRSEIGFRRQINNATLFELKSYHGSEDQFNEVLSACKTFARFLSVIQSVSGSDFDEPQQRDLTRVFARLKQRCGG